MVVILQIFPKWQATVLYCSKIGFRQQYTDFNAWPNRGSPNPNLQPHICGTCKAGIGDKIPVHLRQDRPVKNLRLSLREVYGMIKEIWREKFAMDQQMDEDLYYAWFHGHKPLQKELAAADSSNDGSVTQEQFRFQLRKAFPSKTSAEIQELMDAAESQLKPEDEKIIYKSLFSEVKLRFFLLHKITTANIFRSAFQIIEGTCTDNRHYSITEITVQSDIKRNEGPARKLTNYEEKGRHERWMVTIALVIRTGHSDEEGNPSHFIGVLRNQFSAERMEYLKELRNTLGNNPSKPEDLKAAFLSVDPAVDDETLDRYLSGAFKVSPEQLEVTGPLSPKQLLHNLEAINVRRTGPAAQE
ncbi:unnamed protein product [Ranitomeya imitator]|uniref:EF-hand domain-containing protein n=1 Tax=Ranitomeya imitator TaxID=111125 RepID=A0ABN9LH74_9NEOB|nr:unnamed protein product [Ranitomeya imitator]